MPRGRSSNSLDELARGQRELDDPLAAGDPHTHATPDDVPDEEPLEVGQTLDRLAIELDDEVAGPDAGARRGTRLKQLDDLEVSLNRAAEAAVPMAKNLLVDAVRNITVADAKKILTGGDTSVTEFFADKTRTPLGGTFLPVVHQATSQVGLVQKYDRVVGKAQGLGLYKPEDPTVDHYVTRKALDGLYFMIGEEEKKIRRDPIGTGSAILQKVFGALR